MPKSSWIVLGRAPDAASTDASLLLACQMLAVGKRLSARTTLGYEQGLAAATGTLKPTPTVRILRRSGNSCRTSIKSLLRRKTPAKPEEIDAINDLMEADTMLAERIEGWFAEAELKGMQQGMQQGMQKGKLEGEAQALHRLLEKRFGPLPVEVAAQVASASASQIEAWLDRVLDAGSLADVFGPMAH